MICMELWQFISTEDLFNSTDTHLGGLGFVELYPYLINQSDWSPHLYVRCSASCYMTFPPWQCVATPWLCDLFGKAPWRRPSLGEAPAKGHGSSVLFCRTNTKRKKSKQIDETSGIPQMKEKMGSFLNYYNRPWLSLLICDNPEIL